jgi:hypothetical protein
MKRWGRSQMKYTAFDGMLWRVERLQKATKLAAQISSLPLNHLEHLLHEVRDYKGSLEVVWNVDGQSPHQEKAFETAWEMCGEKFPQVLHLVTEAGADWGDK